VLGELYLYDPFRRPAMFAGTSAGAINPALLAAGKMPEQLCDFWLGFATDPPVDANTPFFRTSLRALATALVRHAMIDVRSPQVGSPWWTIKRA
jgi:predicted acylesterase/phospholipase RssA